MKILTQSALFNLLLWTSLYNRNGVLSFRGIHNFGRRRPSNTDTKKIKFIKSVVHQHFPKAMPGSKVLKRVKRVVKQPQFGGVTADNTLFAQSICPDEINHEKGDITTLFIDYLGEVFHLGGLAGIPFTGKTGFAAYSGHVPDDGHCFVLHAPHIGITTDGELGKYERVGQHAKKGAACGAAIGALNHCSCQKPLPDLSDATAMDQQMNWIIHQVHKNLTYIQNQPSENHQQQVLVEAMHTLGKTKLDAICNVDFGGASSCLFVLSGIQINMPHPLEDYFEPLSFEMHRKNGTIVDLYPKTFE